MNILLERGNMKKQLMALLLAVLMMMQMIPVNVQASEVAGGVCGADGAGNVVWAVDGNGVLVITGTGAMAEYGSEEEQPWWDMRDIITAVRVGEGVTHIGKWVGAYLDGAQSVQLPESLISIGSNAFCFGGYETAVLPDNVETLGNYVLWNCDELKSMHIPAAVTEIGDGSFGHCDALTAITVDAQNAEFHSENGVLYACSGKMGGIDGLYYAGASLVTYPAGKKNILLAESFVDAEGVRHVVRSIRSNALRGGARAMQEIEVPRQVNVIGAYAFQGVNISVLTLPESLGAVGAGAFDGLIDKVVYGGSEAQWNGVDVYDGNTGLERAEYAWNGVQTAETSWKILDGTLIISGSGRMKDYSSQGAPWYARREEITGIAVENGVTHVGSSAFYGLHRVRSVSLADTVGSIGAEAFYGCAALDAVSIPYGVTEIAYAAFRGCENLQSVETYQDIRSIGTWAFAQCRNLKSMDFSAALRSIGAYAFYESGMTAAVLPDALMQVGTSAFEDSPLVSVRIGGNAESIGRGAFCGSAVLESIEVDEENEYYAAQNGLLIEGETTVIAFAGKGNKSVVIPEGIERIGSYAFSGCDVLEQITLPESLAAVEAYAFGDDGALAQVHYEGTQAQWNALPVENGNDNLLGAQLYIGGMAVGGGWYIQNGVLYIEQTGVMTNYKQNYAPWRDRAAEITKVVFAQGLTRVGDYALYGCENLAEITLPASVVEIGHYAFAGTALRNMDIPEGMALGRGVFMDCEALAGITGLTSLPDDLLRGCVSLKDVDLTNVAHIGSFALAGTAVENAAVAEGTKSIGEGAFSGCEKLAAITLPEGLERIGDRAFADCIALGHIELPASVEDIGQRAFCGSGLENIALPEGLEVIPQECFAYCASLTAVALPVSIRLVETAAFTGCSSLETVLYAGNSAQWSAVDIAVKNEPLRNASVVCEEMFSDGILTVSDKNNDPENWADYKEEIRCVVIRPGVEAIPAQAFEGCTQLKSVVFPEGVKEIGAGAFAGCTQLSAITLSETLCTLGAGAFSGCTALESIALPGTLKTIPQSAFEYCTELAAVFVKDGLEAVEAGAFAGCRKLADVYYTGSAAQWEGIAHKRQSNTYFYAAELHCDFEDGAFSLKVTPPYRQLYAKGTDLDQSGLVVLCIAESGKQTDVTREAALSGYDAQTVGRQVITVEYGGQKAYFTVEVFGLTGMSLSLEGRVVMNFYAYFPEDSAYGVLFFRQEPDEAALRSAIDAGAGVQPDCISSGNAVFWYDDLAAKEMNDAVWAVPYVEGEEEVIFGHASKTSVAQYVQAAFDTYENAALRTMLVDMLLYGAAAQEHFSYRTDAPADAYLTQEQRAYATQSVPQAVQAAAVHKDSLYDGRVNITGVSLLLENEVAMNFYAEGASDAVRAELLVFDGFEEGKTHDSAMAYASFDAAKNGGSWMGSLPDIAAKDLRKRIYARLKVCFADGSAAYSPVVCYSVESYAATVLNDPASTPALRSLVNALLRYGDAAERYFG